MREELASSSSGSKGLGLRDTAINEIFRIQRAVGRVAGRHGDAEVTLLALQS